MKVKVRYVTEFGSSASIIKVKKLPSFIKRFTILSITPYKQEKRCIT